MRLIKAVIHKDSALVRALLSAGENPNYCLDAAKLTPLHFAAQHNALEIVPLLITAGANIHATTVPDGQTPLDIAKILGHQEMITLLEEYASRMPFNEEEN